MLDILSEPIAQLVLAVAVLCGLVAVAVYILSKIRPKSIQPELKTEDLIPKFRDSHARGQLSDEEYRNIKTLLGERLRQDYDTEQEEDKAD